MAKATSLQLTNAVLKKCNQPVVSALTALTGMQLTCWDALIEAMKEIYNLADWKFLEARGTFTLGSATSTYTWATDVARANLYSMREVEQDTIIEYLEPDEFELLNPEVDKVGMPGKFTDYLGVVNFDRIPGANEASKLVYYRYWKLGTVPTTSSTTGTCDIPQEFEDDMLVNLATFIALKFAGDPEAESYYIKVFGDGRTPGKLQLMKRQYQSPRLQKVRVTAIL